MTLVIELEQRLESVTQVDRRAHVDVEERRDSWRGWNVELHQEEQQSLGDDARNLG